MSTGGGRLGACGSNVTSRPPPETAAHSVADGHARVKVGGKLCEMILVGVGAPGDSGSNVTCCPSWSTAVHWVTSGHATT